MHPFERLRYIAREGITDPSLIAIEAAACLVSLANQPEALVTASRRLIDFHPSAGPLWWLCSRVLTSGDPGGEARRCAIELDEDQTPGILAGALGPDERTRQITVLLPAELAAAGLKAARPSITDINVLLPQGSYVGFIGGFADIADLGPRIGELEDGSLLLVEAVAGGPDGVLVRNADGAGPVDELVELLIAEWGVSVWAVCGLGRVLPARLFDVMRTRAGEPPRSSRYSAGDNSVAFVPASSLTQVVCPTGTFAAPAGLAVSQCPSPEELLVRAR